MNIKQFLKDGQQVYVKVSVADLHEFFKEVKLEMEEEQKSQRPEEYLTAEDVTALLSVSKTTLWRWDKANYLAPVRVGKRRVYRAQDVRALMEHGGTHESKNADVLCIR